VLFSAVSALGIEITLQYLKSTLATWVPFFDDGKQYSLREIFGLYLTMSTVDAIIFLAPISGFDQVLAEDRSVNRLEDSVLLWKAACSNKLLANVDLVLFLNKCDILEAKLKAGVRLAKYVRTYGDRPNDLDSASKCKLWSLFDMDFVCKLVLNDLSDFRSKFGAIHREYSPSPRKFYGWCTSVTVSILIFYLFFACHFSKKAQFFVTSLRTQQRREVFLQVVSPLIASL